MGRAPLGPLRLAEQTTGGGYVHTTTRTKGRQNTGLVELVSHLDEYGVLRALKHRAVVWVIANQVDKTGDTSQELDEPLEVRRRVIHPCQYYIFERELALPSPVRRAENRKELPQREATRGGQERPPFLIKGRM